MGHLSRLQVEDKMAMKTNAAALIKLHPTPNQVASYTIYQELIFLFAENICSLG